MAVDFSKPTAVTYSNGSTATITYSWSVSTVKTKTEGVNTASIVQTHWKLDGTDAINANTGTFNGATPFTSVGSPNDFIPFSELEESHVISWIQDEVARMPSYSDHIFERIFEQLDSKLNAMVEHQSDQLPWFTGTVTTPVSPSVGP